MSGTLTARGLRASFGAVTVLGGVDLVVGPGDRVGVVAPNGVGKSTLLRVLAGDLTPDDGTVGRAPTTATVVRLTQESDVQPGESLFAHLARRTGVAAATRELDAATVELTASDGAGPAADRYASALDIWLNLGGDDLTERAAALTAELALPADLGERDATALSGGQKARLALAAALLARPDILLLDEPTNDLDDDGLARLESHLRGAPAGVVLVSHDREFLDRVVDRVLEIDQFTRGGTEYRGGWQAYLAERAAARRHAAEAYQEYSDKRDRLADSARRQRQWSQTGARRAATRPDDGDKHVRHSRIQGAQYSAAGATRMDRAIERLDRDAPDEPRDPWELRLAIGETRRAGDIVAQLRGAVIARGDVRLGPLDLTLGWAERVRLTGPNGSGKTSLVDALLGRLPLVAGERYLGPGVVLGELDQSRREFATGEPVMEVVRAAAELSPTEARTLLAKFRLRGDAALRPAAALSPGERTRAGLALLQARGVNCLVLDEPTNHLDIEAIEQLEQALTDYRGTLLLVTHDRRFAATVPVDRTITLP